MLWSAARQKSLKSNTKSYKIFVHHKFVQNLVPRIFRDFCLWFDGDELNEIRTNSNPQIIGEPLRIDY